MAIDKKAIFEEIETYFGAEVAAIYAATDWLREDVEGTMREMERRRGQ